MTLVHRLRGKQEGVVFHLMVAVDVGAVSVAVRSHADRLFSIPTCSS